MFPVLAIILQTQFQIDRRHSPVRAEKPETTGKQPDPDFNVAQKQHLDNGFPE
jgi:hypothetical protein